MYLLPCVSIVGVVVIGCSGEFEWLFVGCVQKSKALPGVQANHIVGSTRFKGFVNIHGAARRSTVLFC